MTRWLAAFVFTQIVEVPIYLWAIARSKSRSFRPFDLAIAFGASAITHPILWLALSGVSSRTWVAATTIAEIVVVLVEALWLRLFAVKRALVWSFVANAASLGLGLLSRALFGMP
jgi:hypothetical protein